MTLNKTINSTAQGYIYNTGASTTSTTNVMFATAKYGSGKVAAIGDSSPCDDGTGGSGNTLYNGYTGDVGVNHEYLLMNATIWLATHTSKKTGLNDIKAEGIDLRTFPNPATNGTLTLNYSSTETTQLTAQLTDLTGKILRTWTLENNVSGTLQQTLDIADIKSGIYLCRVSTATASATKMVVVSK
jgi:hypothetical protein